MTETMEEFGQIIVVKKDGTHGSPYGISSDVVFGRDKESDIRIKLTTVSRKQAMISIDKENGMVSIT